MKRFYIAFVMCLFLAGCNDEESWDCLKSMGDDVSEIRYPGNFNKVYLTDKIDLDYRYSDTCFVEVHFGENIIHHITTQVDGNSLYIDNTATCNWVRTQKKIPLVVIYAPTLAYLENTSSATITMRDTLVSNDFMYEQRGTNGYANLVVNTDSVRVYAHTGFTSINVAGRSTYSGLYNATVGKFNASRLNSDITIVNNSSLQDLKCVANSYLFGEINLSGNILYSGDPDAVDISINGSGRVLPH